MRLIDADLFNIVTVAGVSDEFVAGMQYVLEKLDAAPTIDAMPMVRAEWVVKGQEVFCSKCGKESGHNAFGASSFSDFCPNCGATMRGADMRKGGAE